MTFLNAASAFRGRLGLASFAWPCGWRVAAHHPHRLRQHLHQHRSLRLWWSSRQSPPNPAYPPPMRATQTNTGLMRPSTSTNSMARESSKAACHPCLYAVGVLDVEVDKQGQVTRTYWVRAPGHAPEVMKEIEKTVRQAAPYPVPAHMNKVVYSDVWLWHKSGRFQLDTLTEGQD